MPPPTPMTMSNNTATSSAPLGVTMALPPGTSSHLESQRAEELRRRRRQAQKQPNNNNGANMPLSSSSPPSNPPNRRLAPGRKKASVSNIKNSSSSAANPAVAISLPIDISARREGNEDNDILNCFEDERSRDKDAGGIITRNVADWTTRDIKTSRPMTRSKIVEEAQDAGDDEDEEKEYHGEIESIASADHEDPDDDSVEEKESFKIVTEEEILLEPPPPSEPLVLVNLKALCGCAPQSENEKTILAKQLMESLLGSAEEDKEEGGDDSKSEEDEQSKKDKQLLGDGLSLDFDDRVVELFESGVACHADSSHPIAASSLVKEEEDRNSSRTLNPYAVVPYPEFLSSEKSTGAPTKARSTLRIWKLLHTTPSITQQNKSKNTDPDYSPLLSHVFTHLRNTSRSLLWKADMHRELSLMARREHLAKLKRMQQREYNAWKENVRRERLDKLYDVRETFTLQVGVAKKKYDKFVEEREVRVERELRRRGLHEVRSELRSVETHIGEDSGPNNDEKGMNEYDEDGWGDDTIREEDILGERQFNVAAIEGRAVEEDEEEEEEGENDEWSPLDMKSNPLGMNITLDGVPNKSPEQQRKKSTKIIISNKLEPISHDDNLKRKSERLERKQDQISSATNPAGNQITGDHFKKQQESVRQMLKTNDERIAETTYLKLQERLQNVDNLLESLQEEEWAEEEDGKEERQGGGAQDEYDREDELANGSTLLDQILAMILGGLPPKEWSSSRAEKTLDEKEEGMEHYRYIREEHKSIVKEWLKTFGRLPPFPSDEEPEIESEPLGIGNVEDVTMPFGDGFSLSESKNFHVTCQNETNQDSSAGGSVKRIDLTLTDNDESNWDEVEDWDALFP